jgi:hypothetical protein
MTFKMKTWGMKLKWRRISVLVAAMAGLSTLTFNCAPSMFQSSRFMSLSSSSSSTGIFDAPKTSPYVLMTSKQTYQTMLNVTGQAQAATNTQNQEYNARSGSLSDNSNLTSLTAPMQMAMTSLAGEVCNGLVSKEIALDPASRHFFTQVDFKSAPAQNTSAAFEAAVGVMAQSFWNRAPTAGESALFGQFYADFIGGLTGNNAKSATQTKNLYLATCTAMLSSFDTYTY